MPGLGGQYLSEVFTQTATGADTIDMSRCGMFSIQIGSGQGGGTVQMQQAFNGIFANYGSALTITSSGAIALFDESDGPFGIQRFSVTLAAGTVQIMVTGVGKNND